MCLPLINTAAPHAQGGKRRSGSQELLGAGGGENSPSHHVPVGPASPPPLLCLSSSKQLQLSLVCQFVLGNPDQGAPSWRPQKPLRLGGGGNS